MSKNTNFSQVVLIRTMSGIQFIEELASFFALEFDLSAIDKILPVLLTIGSVLDFYFRIIFRS